MISFKIKMDIPRSSPTAEQSYERVNNLLCAIKNIDPKFSTWYGGLVTMRDSPVQFDDKDLFTAQLKQRVESGFEHEGVSMKVNNYRQTDGDYQPGDANLWFSPEGRSVELTVFWPLMKFNSQVILEVCRELLCSLVRAETVSYAYVNVTDRVPEHDFPVSYKMLFATFAHRKCLGWMAYIPKTVTPQQLPLAADLIDIPGKGTVIVAVNGAFDLNNKVHVRRANEIEMAMVDLDLLPITDPGLM